MKALALLLALVASIAQATTCVVGAPGDGTATFNWTASTSIGVTYNVYSGTTSGGPYPNKVVANVTAPPSSITGLAPGTYYFVATAVTATGVESVVSDEACKSIATPVPAAPTNFTVK